MISTRAKEHRQGFAIFQDMNFFTKVCSLTILCVSAIFANPFDLHWSITANEISQPLFRAKTFAAPHGCATADIYSSSCTNDSVADIYGSDWFALRIPLENGLAYEQLPGMLTLTMSANIDSTLEFKTVLPFRRDLEAWYTDPLGSSWFTQGSELDINQPEEGYFLWNNRAGFVKMGRFKPDMGPSPNSIALGSGVPYHDAIWWHVAIGVARFDWFLSSLNPTLEGTPDSVGGQAPVGSEAWQQSHYTTPNQRNRSYTEPEKTLLLHRVGWDASWGWFAMIEQELIGGKALAPRDFNPFTVWHDQFSDGYSKSSLTAELGIRPHAGTKIYGQLDYEDIDSPVGETSGATAPTTYSYLVGWRQDYRKDSTLTLWSRLDYVYTDPDINNAHLPLLRMTSRILYRSNFRNQTASNFADSYIVDYPLGYRRGPDSKDLWFDLGFESIRHHFGGTFELAYLRQGDKNLWTSWDTASVYSSGAPSGIVETDKRGWISGWMKPWQKGPWSLAVNGGFGLRYLENQDHVQGANGWDIGWSLGMTCNVGK